MTPSHEPLVTARRFLHCCYCCRDADQNAALFTGLGLQLVMRSARERVDGSQLGFADGVVTDACFVYDPRGPRVSPAIEVQAWLDPPTEGAPYESQQHVGLQALGLAVPDPDAGADLVGAAGGALVGRTGDTSPVVPDATVVRDPTGVHLDLVPAGDGGPAVRLAHLRASCRDLTRSVDWYGSLGFEIVAQEARRAVSTSAFGTSPDELVSVARLRLPDERFELHLVEWHGSAHDEAPYPTANHAGLYRFALAVDDTRAAHAALVGRLPGTTGPPELVELQGTRVPDMWIAFLHDPDGITIELVERPRSAFRS